MSNLIYLTFQSHERKERLSDISDDSDYEIIHYLISETEIIDIDTEDNTIKVKVWLEVGLDDGDLDTLTEELDYHFTDTMDGLNYKMELIKASTEI